ncbi:UvrD-helicase domain-containing protein [Pseudomonas sp. HR96]|uniref:UvrD-helicase domain-containing protein n=1 Tax=Pseudomonas sp. HR96 TaxID=1027966 RepID=UPI002A75EC50|nr:UvrD-helicase domain-containing protein [Pseudomonas sp. HR96]WPP02083.1 UvrD-helicase domain-containing protein [Pseudomonas sp. HR96]
MSPSSPDRPFIQRLSRRLFGAREPATVGEPVIAQVPAATLPETPVLFDDWTLPLPSALRKRIQAEVAQRLPAQAQPSAAQWRMIFSRTPATQVVAGAGAGKSTSLVLRLLVLHHYLGYELASTTVITFTRESRNDFIKKMLQVFDLWEIKLSQQQAGEVVRTFHSRLLPLVRSLPGLAQVQAFETLGVQEQGASGNPFDLRINDAQRALLNACYSALLTRDSRFRQLIAALRLQAFALKRLDRDHPEVRKRMTVTALAAGRDEELCDLLEDQWYHAGVWPIEGIEPQRKAVTINGGTFHCHGYIAELDAWVVLGVDPSADADMTRKGARLPVRAEWAVKRTLFQAFCDKPLIWLDTYQQGQRLWGALAGSSVAGPGFDYQVKGDTAAAPLLDAFAATAGFIENLGLDVSAAIGAMDHALLGDDSGFLQALALFWPTFNDFLHQQPPPVMTYNAMFATLGEQAPENLALVPDSLLQGMTHLMVDEFQDISPQIVGWVRACLTEVRRRAVQRPAATSLLCVGDDWQSIYGWRGSAAHYFLAFDREFPASKTTRVLLSDNYRSHQHIIDAAEHLVQPVRSLPGKRGKAREGLPTIAVQVFERNDRQLAQQVRAHHEAGDSILILFRKSSDKSLIYNELSNLLKVDYSSGERRIRLLTYHSAKGLQADAVFLVGDCRYASEPPYRNEVYRLAGFAEPGQADAYDAAQREEILRLAYVAVTRAVRHCYWYVEPARGETAAVARASDRVAGNKPWFEDRRGAQ